MNANRFAAIYDKYHQLYQEAVSSRLTRGLNEQEYIKLAMTAELMDSHDILVWKWSEFEKRQPQAAELQKKLTDSEHAYAKLQEETLKQLRELQAALKQNGTQ